MEKALSAEATQALTDCGSLRGASLAESPLDPGTRQTAGRTGRLFFDPSAGWWVGLLCFANTSSGLYFQ